MTCATCGQPARGKQWWNRDTGYGVCDSCVTEQLETCGKQYVVECYGKPGKHHSMPPRPEQFREAFGKVYAVRLITGSEAMANFYLEHNPDCGVFSSLKHGDQPQEIVICENEPHKGDCQP
jgi:hypothetical protein